MKINIFSPLSILWKLNSRSTFSARETLWAKYGTSSSPGQWWSWYIRRRMKYKLSTMLLRMNDDRTHYLWRMRYIFISDVIFIIIMIMISFAKMVTSLRGRFNLFSYFTSNFLISWQGKYITITFFYNPFFLLHWYFGGCVTYLYLGLSDLFRSSWPSPQMNADEIQQCNTRPCWWWWKAVITFVFNNFTSQAVQNVQGPEIHLYADGGLTGGRTLDNLEGQG